MKRAGPSKRKVTKAKSATNTRKRFQKMMAEARKDAAWRRREQEFDREMKSLYRITAELAADMNIAFTIPREWR